MKPVEQAVSELISADRGSEEIPVTKINILAEKYGDALHAELLSQLMGLTLPGETARRYWQDACTHHAGLHPPLNSPKALRTALLDYLYRVAGLLEDPRVLEAEQLSSFRLAAATDGLTGLFNQTYFKLTLGKLLESKDSRDKSRFAVALMDLDRFKQYNDRCGHLAGDKALALTASIIKDSIRQGDIACRYGGEEFGLILHRVSVNQAFEIVERIRSRIEQTCFPQQELISTGNLTISCGIAFHSQKAENLEDILKRADTELYKAKATRNAVSPSLGNKRSLSRQVIQTLVDYATPRDRDFETALSLDLSQGGMALACQEAISPGTVITVRFRQPFWKADHSVDATVRSVIKSEGSSVIRLGLEFCKNLGQDLSSLTQQTLGQEPMEYHFAATM